MLSNSQIISLRQLGKIQMGLSVLLALLSIIVFVAYQRSAGSMLEAAYSLSTGIAEIVQQTQRSVQDSQKVAASYGQACNSFANAVSEAKKTYEATKQQIPGVRIVVKDMDQTIDETSNFLKELGSKSDFVIPMAKIRPFSGVKNKTEKLTERLVHMQNTLKEFDEKTLAILETKEDNIPLALTQTSDSLKRTSDVLNRFSADSQITTTLKNMDVRLKVASDNISNTKNVFYSIFLLVILLSILFFVNGLMLLNIEKLLIAKEKPF